MRILLCATLLLGLAAGCKKGEGTILLTVTADPAITHVTRLDVVAGAAPAVQVTPAQPFDLPPAQTLALVAPASLGATLHLRVTARNGDVIVGEGEGDAPLAGGKRTDAMVTLGPPGSIGGGDGGSGSDGGGSPNVPRQLAPISGSTVTSKRPTLHWLLPAGVGNVQVDICATRACSTTLAGVTVDGAQTAGAPSADLPRGLAYWRVRGTSAGQSVVSKTWVINVPAKSTSHDTSQRFNHDFNGDGNADVAVSATQANNVSLIKTGRAYMQLFAGGAPALMDSPDTVVSFFGSGIAGVGDVDGDGLADVLVSAFHATNTAGEAQAGRVYLFSWSEAQNKPVLKTQIEGKQGPMGFAGLGMGPAGDVNGDGYADIAYSNSKNSDGKVYLLMGSASGPDVDHPVILDGAAGGMESFGNQITTAGDINGDGYDDLVIGAYGAVINGMSYAGRIYVYLGGPSGVQQPAIQAIDGPDGPNTFFPQALIPLGDVNGDGYADILAGDNGGMGHEHIYHGGPGGLLHEARTLNNPDGVSGGWGGSGVSGWTDFNGDGYHDFASSSTQASGATKVYIFLGGPDGITTNQSNPLTGPDNNWGYGIMTPGDQNLDGLGDLVIGSLGFNGNIGRTYLYSGSSDGVSAANPVTTDGVDAGGKYGGPLGRRPLVRRR